MKQLSREQRDVLIKTANYMIERSDTSDYSENIRQVAMLAMSCLAQEPVMYMNRFTGVCHAVDNIPNPDAMDVYLPLYAAPPAPVVPDGWVLVPVKLTADNGAKGALSGEFSETKLINCPECFGDDDCETCDGSGRIEIKVPVSWTSIKGIWAKGVEYFAAHSAPVVPEPVSNREELAGWIPCSERMPGGRESVLLWDADMEDVISGHYSHSTGNFYQAGMIIDNEITHWQPLPAPPKDGV